MIKAIQAAGGQILQFSGDAVTAAWPCGKDPVSQTIRAITAGLALQDACRSMTVAGIVGLNLRVSLTEGPDWIAHLASEASSPTTVIWGKVLSRSADRSGVSQGVFLDGPLRGKVAGVLSPQAWIAAEAGGIRVLSIGGITLAAAPAPPVRPDQAPIIARFVPEHLGDLLDGTLTDWLAEFRSSHILFARFQGFGFQGEGDLPGLAVLAAGTERAVAANGGLRLKFAIDDKGLILMAAWGLQSRSFGDNAERSLAAAAQVHQAAQIAGLTAYIGVTGGKVFAGLAGSGGYMEYTVFGDAVNRAAALSSGAAGQTRVDGQTKRDGARRFQFVEAGVATRKGQDAAAQYIVAGEALGQAAQNGEMVGRDKERANLNDLVARPRQGIAPGVLHVVGEAGLGKSRLAGHLQSRLDRAAIPTLRLNADALRRTTGFYPWRQLVAAVAAADIQTDGLQALLGHDPALSELLPLLSPVPRTEVPDTIVTASLFGGGRAEKTQTVIIALLERLIAPRLRF